MVELQGPAMAVLYVLGRERVGSEVSRVRLEDLRAVREGERILGR